MSEAETYLGLRPFPGLVLSAQAKEVVEEQLQLPAAVEVQEAAHQEILVLKSHRH